MKKVIGLLSILLAGASFIATDSHAATRMQARQGKTLNEQAPTTRNDAVIFKVHDIKPIAEDGVVKGCDYTVTLYNRTSINFRTFTVNLNWKDTVDERFQFDRYVESIVGKDEALKHKDFLIKKEISQPMQSAITVNAFGANKQISVKSHIDNEKCYLLLTDAEYTVTPCDIARSIDSTANFGGGIDSKDCTGLFQLVSTSNPEYFGQFKDTSATELAAKSEEADTKELTDIDSIITKIVDNLGTSDRTLTDIN